MQISALALTLLPALAAAAGKFKIPAGSPEGHYTSDGTIDPATGFAKLTFLGPIDEAALNATKRAVENGDIVLSAPSGLRRRKEGPNCNNRSAGSNPRDAEYAFAANADNQYFSGKWLATYKGDSVAYACNYGNGQTVHRNDLLSAMNSVDGLCGWNKAGWFEYPSWKLNYGRDQASHSFC